MTKGDRGIWTTEKSGDLNGEYYTYLVTTDGIENEVTDPYAKAVGVNGNRAMVLDMETTNPEGWENDAKPELIDPTDSIIYEMHIRDFSIDEKSGMTLEYKGKYNGVWQEGTTIPGTDVKTGIDHLKELGVNTVHLLPTFDHRSIDFGIVASTKHDEVKLGQSPGQYGGYVTVAWANEPYQTVSYVSAHDNNTLWDKFQITNPNASKEELMDMNKMAAALVLTSQGIPFIHAGEELARTKVNPDGSFNHNSYNAPDSVNKIDWSRKEEYSELFDYYKGLIELRKSHKVFRMNTTEDIQNSLNFLDVNDSNVVAYSLDGTATNDKWSEVAIIFNANEHEVEVTLPSNDWVVVVNETSAGVKELATIEGATVKVPGKASYVLVDKNSYYGENEEIKVDKVKKLKGVATNNSVKLTWEAPKHTLGLDQYVIYQDGKEIATVKAGTTEFEVTNLGANKIYGFKVAAKYSNGEVSKPTSINIRTKK